MPTHDFNPSMYPRIVGFSRYLYSVNAGFYFHEWSKPTIQYSNDFVYNFEDLNSWNLSTSKNQLYGTFIGYKEPEYYHECNHICLYHFQV